MDIFRTPITLLPSPLLTHAQTFVSLGSCFADSIGARLIQNKWAGLVNPFGTLFHPKAIFNVLKADADLPDELFLKRDGLVFHYHLPKTFHATNRALFQDLWQERKTLLHTELERPGSVLLLTLGTALLYQISGGWVANCHQQPARLFTKALIPLETMAEAWATVLARLPPTLKVIITVSPVRHLKEGLVESSLSKSLLRVLAHHMVEGAPDRFHYFPAFELMMDDLRDYRFYEADMLHPSDQAIDYIWSKFQSTFMPSETRDLIAQWQKLSARLAHRPLHPESESTKAFLIKLAADVQAFETRLKKYS